MAHGTVKFETDNIFINAQQATINQQLTVDGDSIFFNNPVYFRRSDGFITKPQFLIKTETQSGHTVWIQCDSRTDFDTFWLCQDPLFTLDITFYGGNHIVQFEVMTQEDLEMEPEGSFGFTLTIDDQSLYDKININKPFNFEPGKKYMIIFQQEESTYPINIFWTELTDYAN